MSTSHNFNRVHFKLDEPPSIAQLDGMLRNLMAMGVPGDTPVRAALLTGALKEIYSIEFDRNPETETEQLSIVVS